MHKSRSRLPQSRLFAVLAALSAIFPALIWTAPAQAAELIVPLPEAEPYVPSADMPVDYQIAGALVTLGGSDAVPTGIPSKVDDPGGLPDETGDVTGSGCTQQWIRIDYHNYRGDRIMWFKQTKNWCWNNRNKLTSVGVTPSGNVHAWAEPVWNYDGVLSSVNYYYDNGRRHYSYREGKFSAHCGPWSCGGKTPELIIRAHGSGTWNYWGRG
jgi:hypothetical protein